MAIEFRWAEDKAIAGVTQTMAVDLSCSREKQFLHDKAILFNADIAKIDVLPMPNTNGEKVYLEVRLTKEAEKVMMASSEANQNKPLVVIVDGKIVAAIVVRAKMTNVIPIVSPLSKEEAERIVQREVSLLFHEPASLIVLDSLLPNRLPPPVSRQLQVAEAAGPTGDRQASQAEPGGQAERRYFGYFTAVETWILATGTLFLATLIFLILDNA